MQWSEVSVEIDLHQLMKSIVAAGDYGLTLWTGKTATVHSKEGSRPVSDIPVSLETISSFLREILDSRKMRELHERGFVAFTCTFEDHVCFVGRARNDAEILGVELRRLAQPSAGGNAATPRASA